MKSFSLLILLLLFTPLAHAQLDTDASAYKNLMNQFNRAQNASINPGKFVCPEDESKNLSCPFLDKHCEVAKMGKFLHGLFNQSYTPQSDAKKAEDPDRKMGFFIDSPPSDITKFCKNYPSLSHAVREKFWIYFFMQMAYDESSCNDPSADNWYAAGAIQLEPKGTARDELRPTICHSQSFKKIYGPKATIQDFEVNTHCALAMFAVQFAPPGSEYAETRSDLATFSKGMIFSKGSYWGKLRQPEGRVAKKIKKFSACGNP